MEQNKGCLGIFLSIIDNILGVQKKPSVEYPYKLSSSVLTKAEISFYHVLAQSIPQNTVLLSKVRLADFIKISGGFDRSAFNRIAMKHVDFLLCDFNTLAPLLAIELNDSSHSKKKTIERDEFVRKVYEVCSLPIVCVRCSKTYVQSDISKLIEEKII